MTRTTLSLSHLLYWGLVIGWGGVTVAESSFTVRILGLAWLSFGGNILKNDDVYSSTAIIPVAIKHFNERLDNIFPELSKYKECGAQLALANDTLYDTRGLPNIGMSYFINLFGTRSFNVVLAMRTEVGLIECALV